ncbi:type II toxin-antitoxin system VapC family toxin [Phormidesmis sp. 146-33]
MNPGDEWHSRVKTVANTLNTAQIFTTDEIFVEVLTFSSTRRTLMRKRAVELVKSTMMNPRIRVIQQTRDSFLAGIELYETRSDKEYSLTDCISMNTMRQLGLTEVLTHDKHFAQEGFVILFAD